MPKNPVELLENLGELLENPVKLLENLAELLENPVELPILKRIKFTPLKMSQVSNLADI